VLAMSIIEDQTVTVKCRTAIKVLIVSQKTLVLSKKKPVYLFSLDRCRYTII